MAQIKSQYPEIAYALGDREFRLPTEWEWEYAASGGRNWNTLNYLYSGTSTATELDLVAVHNTNKVGKVGTKKPNYLGLYDMSGNVQEFCSGLGYYSVETEYTYMNNILQLNSDYRPARGGSYDLDMHVTDRDYRLHVTRYPQVGFRLAL